MIIEVSGKHVEKGEVEDREVVLMRRIKLRGRLEIGDSILGQLDVFEVFEVFEINDG